jgi:hypothetical protein
MIYILKKTLISLFDYTGNWSRPYKEHGWNVVQVDIQLGINFMYWDHEQHIRDGEVKILCAMPCTDYALSGAKHFENKDADGTTAKSQEIMEKFHDMIVLYKRVANLSTWALENPMSRIHTLNPWLGKPKLKFDPWQYAGYDPIPMNSGYYKKTWLWGQFYNPKDWAIRPEDKDNPGWKKLGGKSLATKNKRSATPLGFAYAFYEANH